MEFESLPHRQSILPQIDTNLPVVNGLFQHPPPDAQPQSDPKNTHVRVHNVHQLEKILHVCIEHDVQLIPPIVLGSFVGLRPNEVHSEEARYAPLVWEAVDRDRNEIHIDGQKVRGLSVRDLSIPANAMEWLRPFRGRTGNVWDRAKSYNRRLKKLIENKARLQVVYDGFRHSFASYRIRQLKGDLNQLAEEMGNSPRKAEEGFVAASCPGNE